MDEKQKIIEVLKKIPDNSVIHSVKLYNDWIHDMAITIEGIPRIKFYFKILDYELDRVQSPIEEDLLVFYYNKIKPEKEETAEGGKKC